jgi:hypothetical protein
MKIEKHPKSFLLQVPSHLWDGNKQLSGTLSLTQKKLIFEIDDFQKSHLSLTIPLVDIESAEHFLLFEFARNGIKITSKIGVDLYVLDDPLLFRKELKRAIEKL